MSKNIKVSAVKRDKKLITSLAKGLVVGDFRLYSKKNCLDTAKLMQYCDGIGDLEEDIVVVMNCTDNQSTYNGVRFAKGVELWLNEDYLQARELAIELKGAQKR